MGRENRFCIRRNTGPIGSPTALIEVVDILLHPVGAVTLHLVRDMAVHIQGEAGCGMAQVPLHRLDVVSGLNRDHGGMYVSDHAGVSLAGRWTWLLALDYHAMYRESNDGPARQWPLGSPAGSLPRKNQP